MTDEKPLHVRVAEALGWWQDCRPPRPNETHGQWVGVSANRGHWGSDVVPRFDTSWKHTGPLIEKYGISIVCEWRLDESSDWCANVGVPFESGSRGDEEPVEGDGPTPLVAVCNLILALHAAGKL